MHIQNSGPPQQKHRGFGACSSRAVRAHAASIACSTGDSGDLLGAALGHDAPLVFDGQGRAELAFHFWCAGRSP